MLIGVPKEIKRASSGRGHRLRDRRGDPALAKGVNIVDGHITYPGMADAFGVDCADVQAFLVPPAQA